MLKPPIEWPTQYRAWYLRIDQKPVQVLAASRQVRGLDGAGSLEPNPPGV
jgi:hypothetical protein